MSTSFRQIHSGWRNDKMSDILSNLTCDLFVCHRLGLGITECEQQDEDDCLNTICQRTGTFSCGFMDQTLVLHVTQDAIKHWTAGDACKAVKVIPDIPIHACYFYHAFAIKVHHLRKTLFFITLASLPSLREFWLFSVLVLKRTRWALYQHGTETLKSGTICHPVRTNLEKSQVSAMLKHPHPHEPSLSRVPISSHLGS